MGGFAAKSLQYCWTDSGVLRPSIVSADGSTAVLADTFGVGSTAAACLTAAAGPVSVVGAAAAAG